jgi:multidrug efflux system membrane fusion protein
MKKSLLTVLLLCLCGALWFARKQPPVAAALESASAGLKKLTSSPNPTPTSPQGKGPEGGPPVPVITGIVESKEVPIYLNGLGNVQGFNSVTIRPRVEGQLEKVAFTEGQNIQAGQILAQIDPRPFQAALDQAAARRKQDEALLANAKRDLARDLALLAEKAGTAQKADTQQALVDQLEATLKSDDAAIEAATVQLGYATIHSPISGRAGIRLIDEGNVVRTQDANGLVVITQMQPVSVVFTLPEQQLQTIRSESEKSSLQVLAVGRDNAGTLAEGTLSVIDNQIDSSTGTIRLKATFPNTDLKLWPGQFVNVRLRVAVRADATVVPAQVVQQGPAGTFAFVINSESVAELRPLQINRIEEGLALIDSGLQPGERVVVDGQYRLQPGSKVRAGEGGGKGPANAQARAEESGRSKTQP